MAAWVQFEIWPSDILFIDSSTEPASGDVDRLWYQHLCTLNGQDGAAATITPGDTELIPT